MIVFKPKRTLFLLLALLLSVTAFGQTLNPCSKTLPCDVLDIAQAKIEKGSICEQQRTNDSLIIKSQAEIIRKLEKTKQEDDEEKIRLNLKITELSDKSLKRGKQRFSWSAVAVIVGRVSNWFF
jgi:hypothetical protein